MIIVAPEGCWSNACATLACEYTRVESIGPMPARAIAATLNRQYSPLGASNCTVSPTPAWSRSARREPIMIEPVLFRKSSKLPSINWRRGNHIGELPAHPHDFIRICDAFKVEAAARRFLGAFSRNHERFVAGPET